MSRAARTFLASGRLGRTDPAALAAACGRLIMLEAQRSLKAALPRARRLVKQARPHGGILLQTALRALGWTHLAGGDYGSARKRYLEARDLPGVKPLDRARIDRTLIDIYMYLGDFAEARRRARLAMDTFRRLGADGDLAKTRINYANLSHRQDRHREACRQYERAAESLERLGDSLGLAFCQYNLANVLVQLFDLTRAEELYRSAERRFTENGMALNANECRYGLAWLNMLQGSFHIALLGLAECEKQYARAGRTKGTLLCQLDRAETYLSLNLFTDALQAATAAEKRARKMGLRYEAAKAAFYRAKAAYAGGENRAAREALKRATADFKAEGNRGFLGAVELTAVQMSPSGTATAQRLARARQRFSRAQLPLWEAICDLHLLTVDPEATAVQRRLRLNPAVKSVPHLYALWQTIMGDRHMNHGKMTQARQHWINAAETLDAIRAKLPPVELQSAFMKGRSDPYLRLTHSLAGDDPAQAAAWSERHRSSGLWSPSRDKSPDHDHRRQAARSLADLAQRVSALSTQITNKSGIRATGALLPAGELERLQRQVRLDLCRVRAEGGAPEANQAFLIREFERVSRRHPVVQFHYDGPDLLAFVHSDGEVRRHRYDSGRRIIRQFQGFWQILLSRTIQNTGVPRDRDVSEERRLFAEIGRWLWSPLEISAKTGTVLVLPEGRTANLPWQALEVNGCPLSDRHALVLAPSLRHYLNASRIHPRTDRVEVFVGDTAGLSYCREELSGLAAQADRRVTVHDPCRRSDWPNHSRAGIWHYTGHARLRSDNPFYSSLELADAPLFAADFRLMQNRVGLVTLAACRTGQQTYVPGEESSGLVRALLEMGARNVLAGHWAIADRPSAVWMGRFYDHYLGGESIHTAARQAAQHVREQYKSAYHWAAFSLFGAV